ncbi:MAG: glutamine synthetase family protein [Actinomycetota bacterium]|nr:glutamine synthetase family protein [Actinomycetota bacterium]
MDLAEAEHFLASIETVECCFPDTWGVLTGRRMPTARFLSAAREGLSMPNAPFAWDIDGHIEPLPYANPDTGFPNMHILPDLSTLRHASWAEATAFCLMDALEEPGGRPNPVASRGILRRAIERLGEAGYDAWVAPELEFYLCTESWEPLYPDRRNWSMTLGAEVEPVLGEIRSALLSAGVPVESSQTEYGPGQMEVNVAPSSALEAADHAAILKYVVKVVARKHGLRAAFMPMPFQEGSGSGHHLHLSLRDKDSEENAFAANDVDNRELPNSLMRSALAGVLDHMVELTAVNLPSVNAYNRLFDYTFAPNRVSWALDNRTVAVRIPPGDGDARRLEIRTASSDANPYLILAGALASVADGIERRLEPQPATRGDAYKDGEATKLPASLDRAVEVFEGSPFCKEVFGEVFVETFSILARNEQQAFLRSVTDWERNRYLAPS